jgi:putative restriction endonuclease
MYVCYIRIGCDPVFSIKDITVLTDNLVRTAAMNWLQAQVALYQDTLPRQLLEQGFELEGQRIHLVSPKGIFRPRVLGDFPLTITTTPKGPYSDHFGMDGLLHYKYRDSNPDHPDNIGLLKAMQRRIPLIYFHGVVPGKYLAAWPVYIVAADPAAFSFTVMVDDYAAVTIRPGVQPIQSSYLDETDNEGTGRRKYITTQVCRRMHQQIFRARVLEAYREQCAFCRLRHRELIDAAHIVPDSEPEGEPVVSNGIALCKLHHAAFDSFFIGINPDLMIEVRPDILEEEDGPMLQHGLKGLHRQRIQLPRNIRLRPDRRLVEKRYSNFICAQS